MNAKELEQLRKSGQWGRLYQGIVEADDDLGKRAWNVMVKKASTSPFFNRILQHGLEQGLYSDAAGALGVVYDMVSNAAQPNMIGRDLIKVVPATKPVIRYPRAKTTAKAQKISEKSPLLLGENYDYVDIDCTPEIATGQKWTESFVEDAEWNVLERQTKAIGEGLAYTETEDVIALYDGIAAGDLAGGSEISLSTPITWAEFLSLLKAIDNENRVPRVVAVTPEVFYELFNIEEFINSMYVTSEKTLRPGVLKIFAPNDLIIVKSSLVTKTLVIDTEEAAVMGLRRDAMIKPWENPAKMEYGVVGSERYGLEVLRTEAVTRGDR